MVKIIIFAPGSPCCLAPYRKVSKGCHEKGIKNWKVNDINIAIANWIIVIVCKFKLENMGFKILLCFFKLIKINNKSYNDRIFFILID